MARVHTCAYTCTPFPKQNKPSPIPIMWCPSKPNNEPSKFRSSQWVKTWIDFLTWAKSAAPIRNQSNTVTQHDPILDFESMGVSHFIIHARIRSSSTFHDHFFCLSMRFFQEFECCLLFWILDRLKKGFFQY